MYKLPKTAVGAWDHFAGDRHLPRVIDLPCPHCHRPFVTFTTAQRWNNHSSFESASATCPGCKKDVHFWLLVRGKANTSESVKDVTDIYIDPDPIPAQEYDERIDQVSANFGVIYRQAIQAEMLGLDALVGIGYRKAIEFLLKDWIIHDHPDERDKIAKMNLADCVKKYIDDPSLKNGFERAVWLGNDETHYERTWQDKDIDDLKRLLHASLYKMACEIELKSLDETMPYKGK